MNGKISRSRNGSATVRTMTFTTHVLDVDLTDELGQIDPTDGGQVVVDLRLPSGRSKRVRIDPGSLVPPNHADLNQEPWA